MQAKRALFAGYASTMRLARVARPAVAGVLLAIAMQSAMAGAPTDAGLVAELARIGGSLDPTLRVSGANAAAKARLDELQRQHPDVPEVYRELARYYLIVGYLRGDEVEPAHLEAAAQALDRAIALKPDYAEAWVVRGHVHRLQGQSELAHVALDRAERIGTDSPWLPLNRAELLIDGQRYEDALALLRDVQARKGITDDVRHGARDAAIRALKGTGRLDEVDRLYREAMAESPGSAWQRGNYASFLLCWRDDEAGAIKHAQDARRIMDYGMARLTQTAALYRRWARESVAKRTKAADESWNAARAVLDMDPAIAMQDLCGGGSAVLRVLEAMRVTGQGDRIPPMLAVMMAADRAPRSVPGLFVLPVRSVGGNRGDVFLGSEEDYRDQRNLSIRITPAARRELARQMGSDSLDGFKGMTIEVLGSANRVRIDFRENGVPTGKFYYQTHVVVTQADQITVRESRPAL